MVDKYFTRKKQQIATESYFEKVREKLKLTKKQLPDSLIKKVIKLNNKLIADWIVNNADGFQIKDNGTLIVSKWLPKCLRGEKLEKIEEIMNNPKNDDYMKEMFTARYNKSLGDKYRTKNKFINLHSFFYIYRVMWFNSRNCKFDKAEIYEFKADKALRIKLNEKIVEGKEFFEWNFSDFRTHKRKEKEESKYLKKKKALEKLKKKKKMADYNLVSTEALFGKIEFQLSQYTSNGLLDSNSFFLKLN